ncbi:uridine kinase [Actinoplanes sp. Pm04-4]|uniref:Uridine kinase n=1 Tax=Paractinoplanes pyxinae TaxID=2997416 RepID=A0ABT4BA67_9ACTN|nr:uridine kinase [Actinoplanes pyxinae]MCY1143407.1 uridine kinase [Actinoplanes pyxinae]
MPGHVARRPPISATTNRVAGLVPPGAARVAVDGVDGVGKTTFAAELAQALRERGRDVVQVSADDFHQPRAVRHRRGRDSPEGFWLDSYDYPALLRDVLRPLGPGGDRRFRRAAHDLRTDAILDLDWEIAPPEAVLIVDGLFLHRDELRGCWELTIFLDAPFELTVARMAERDGSHPDPEHPSLARYVGGQRLYFAACHPQDRADVLIDHSDPTAPKIVRP